MYIYLTLTILLLALIVGIFNIIISHLNNVLLSSIKHQNKRLSLIQQSGDVLVWIYNIQTQDTYRYNLATRTFSTYTILDLASKLSKDDFQTMYDGLQEMINGRTEQFTFNTAAKVEMIGTIRYFKVTITVLERKDEKIIRLMAVQKDITEHTISNQHMAETYSKYRAILEAAPVDITLYDKDLHLVQMNNRIHETLMINDLKSIEQKTEINSILPLFSIDTNNMEQYYSSSIIDFDKLYANRTDNSWINYVNRRGIMYYEFMTTPVYDKDGTLINMFTFGNDITEKVRMFRKQRENIHQLDLTTRAVSNYIRKINNIISLGGLQLIKYDPTTKILILYHQIGKIKRKMSQLECLDITDQQYIDRARHALEMTDNREDCEIHFTFKSRNLASDGQQKSFEISLLPQYDHDGRVECYLGLNRDITEITNTDERLQAESIKAAEEESAKNVFLKNMSYEIRTPLNAVVGFSELLEGNYSKEDEELFIKEIKENSQRLLLLINDILFLSRLDANMIKITPKLTDFAQTFASHCMMGFYPHRQEKVKYQMFSFYEHLEVEIDDQYLGMIIEKLCASAARHTKNGTIKTRYVYHPSTLVITIEDTGEGISDNFISHVFDRFAFNKESTDTQAHGTGLNFAICKSLIKAMGGDIQVQSEVNMGTTVWINIPCTAHRIEQKKHLQGYEDLQIPIKNT